MIADFVHMDLVPGTQPLQIEEGQTVLVQFEEMQLPMKVLVVYSDGTFDGEVIWYEA